MVITTKDNEKLNKASEMYSALVNHRIPYKYFDYKQFALVSNSPIMSRNEISNYLNSEKERLLDYCFDNSIRFSELDPSCDTNLEVIEKIDQAEKSIYKKLARHRLGVLKDQFIENPSNHHFILLEEQIDILLSRAESDKRCLFDEKISNDEANKRFDTIVNQAKVSVVKKLINEIKIGDYFNEAEDFLRTPCPTIIRKLLHDPDVCNEELLSPEDIIKYPRLLNGCDDDNFNSKIEGYIESLLVRMEIETAQEALRYLVEESDEITPDSAVQTVDFVRQTMIKNDIPYHHLDQSDTPDGNRLQKLAAYISNIASFRQLMDDGSLDEKNFETAVELNIHAVTGDTTRDVSPEQELKIRLGLD